MQTIEVVNIKCGGCAASIKSALEKKGVSDVGVDISGQIVSFNGDAELVKKTLSKMGYPEAGSPEAESLLKKTKSYISCAVGKMK